MISIAVGLIFVAAAVWGLSAWRADVQALLRGILPILFFVGGALVVLAGISGIRDSMLDASKSKDDSANA
ncbi:MAG: hypothetical protein CVU77_07035 [Elusimicrobia bacterium HGW-Elusimicrobia-1]|jgi:hypothetical protein|nr:MAG: hypothetical protein CVU77_07035 [Elusimicrobia bacterium HGW-Elusimicrobia-1]